MDTVYLFQDQNSPEIYGVKNLVHLKALSLLPEFSPEEFSFIVLNVKGVEELAYEIILQFLFNGYLNRNLKFTLILVGALNKGRFYEKYPKYYTLSELKISYQSNTPLDELLIENHNLIHLSKFTELIDENNLSISKPYGSRHQLTNEWGAYKLAHTADLTYLLEKIESLNPEFKRPYFSFLKCKHKIYLTSEPLKELSLPIDNASFLLIDDNYDKGWSLVFEHILAQEATGGFRLEVLHDDFQNFRAREQEIMASIFSQIDSKKICGVLLDLRLNASEESEQKFEHTNIRDFSGGRILVAIKEKYPCLPVIIVTASNKVWNAEQLRQAGADGFFLKEDPTMFIAPEVSRSNYRAFKELLRDCYEKYEKLNPFWKHIKEVERGNYIEEKTISTGPAITYTESTKIEERIKERLYMFAGLIKRNFEDSKFNRSNFFYSGIELAFLTLWSSLIDIQFTYYQKNNSEISIENYLISSLSLNHKVFLKKLARNQFECFVSEPPYRLFIRNADWKTKQDIGAQIAFLILSLAEAKNVPHSDTNRMLGELIRIKELRNKLYLTHGKENDDFFTKTVEEQSGIRVTLTDCERLFEIVYFLLKVEIIYMGT